jgi:hypothetical protein
VIDRLGSVRRDASDKVSAQPTARLPVQAAPGVSMVTFQRLARASILLGQRLEQNSGTERRPLLCANVLTVVTAKASST